MITITVTRPELAAPPVMTVYSAGKPVIAVPVPPKDAIDLIRNLAKELRI